MSKFDVGIPIATLRVGLTDGVCSKPFCIEVFHGKNLLAVIVLDEFRRAAEELDVAESIS